MCRFFRRRRERIAESERATAESEVSLQATKADKREVRELSRFAVRQVEMNSLSKLFFGDLRGGNS